VEALDTYNHRTAPFNFQTLNRIDYLRQKTKRSLKDNHWSSVGAIEVPFDVL